MKNLSLKHITLLVVITLFASCVSVQKYNSRVTAKHSPKELKKDVDYAYKKLKKFHPDLYWYISEDSLNARVNTLKNSLIDSLSSRDFYLKIAPVIASVKQGHLNARPPFLKQTKEDVRLKGKATWIFSPIEFNNINNCLIITDNYGSDSLLKKGSEVIKVDNQDTKELIKSFMPLTTGDGYNKTFVNKKVYNWFDVYYTFTHGQKDSVLLTLKTNDSIYNHYIKQRYVRNERSSKDISTNINKDTTLINGNKINEISKEEQRKSKEFKKLQREWRRDHGYNEYTKQCNRKLTFFNNDSIKNIAYLKIRSFTDGYYRDFYSKCFEQIDSAKCETLIIDLRGNTGGRISEVNYLYSYLTDTCYVFGEKGKMTRRTSYLYKNFHSFSVGNIIGSILFSPFIIAHNILSVSTEKNANYKKFTWSKYRNPKENNYKGKIYVLIDGMTFSASSLLATHLKATDRATFVGEETGGAYNGSVAGKFADFELPNSKVIIRSGLITLKTKYTVMPEGYGIKPDVEISSTTFNQDSELNWILNSIIANSSNK